MKVCLIVVFNHKFERNLEKLDKMYEGRFTNIYYLMPFYAGDREDVIPVYDSSFQFQGFFAQGSAIFCKEKFDYYFTVADDIVLRKEINENNFLEYFQIKEGESFIDSLKMLSRFNKWGSVDYIGRYYNTWLAFHKAREVNFKGEIPERNEAIKRAKKYGFTENDCLMSIGALLNIHNGRMTFEHGIRNIIKDCTKEFLTRWSFIMTHMSHLMRVLRKKEDFGFPVFCGWSDILIIYGPSMKEFCHLCGVFAAQRIFAEIAIPTAMVQTCSSVIVNPQNDLFLGTLTHKQLEKINQEYNYDLNMLLDNWPSELLYLHPFKLSQWHYEV